MDKVLNEEEKGLLDEIIALKVKNAYLTKKKRVLTEELFQQYLEGESEPKKKKRVGDDLKKKKGAIGKKNEDDSTKDDPTGEMNPVDENIDDRDENIEVQDGAIE